MLRFRLAGLIASAVLLLGCGENPDAPSGTGRLPLNAAVLGSKSTAPGPGGVAGQVALIEGDVLALGNLFGVAPPPPPKNNGIPHRLDAAAVQVQVIQVVINDQISQVNARIAGSTATPTGLAAFLAKLESAHSLAGSLERESLLIDNMFEMQLLMNRLSQITEMSTAAMSGVNQAIADMARDVKG